MFNTKHGRKLVLVMASLVSAIALSFAMTQSGRTQQGGPCNNCEEEYQNCLVEADRQAQECRRNGGDESQCENARAAAEQTCQNNRTWCWDFCAEPKVTPSPPGTCPSSWDTVGAIESINSSGDVTGWASDPDFRLQKIYVELYVDGNRMTGQWAGTVLTNIARPDLGLSGTPGFQIRISDWFRDGQPHTLTAFGGDSCGTATYWEIGSTQFTLYP